MNRETQVRCLRLLCLAVLAWIAWQVRSLADSSSLEDDLLPPSASLRPSTGSAASTAGATSTDGTKAASTLAPRHQVILAKALFGKAQKKVVPPALIGILGDYAIIRTPQGQRQRFTVGQAHGSLKLLRIGTNRALVEVDGKKKIELTLFSGIGGLSLLEAKKEPPKSGDNAPKNTAPSGRKDEPEQESGSSQSGADPRTDRSTPATSSDGVTAVPPSLQDGKEKGK